MIQDPTTVILIAVTVITSIYAWNKPEVYNKWMFNPYATHHQKQYYRFLTSGFIHSNSVHLLFNMITLFFFGRIIERIYVAYFEGLGIVFYLITYLAGIIIANLRTYFKYRNAGFYNSLGASGGVAAILFASILYRPTSPLCLYFTICIPAFMLGAFYLIYTYYSGKRMSDNINHDAHLLGSLFGIGFTILLRPAVLLEFVDHVKEFNFYDFSILSILF